MSEFVKKAAIHEEKGKWKIAADTYFSASKEFLQAGKTSEAKDVLQKAIENAEKAMDNYLLVDSILTFEKIATKEEKKELLKKAIKPLNELITLHTTKKDNQKILDLLEKKELIARFLKEELEETIIRKGTIAHEISLSRIISNKEEERKEGLLLLKQGSEAFLEFDKKELKVEGETKAFALLLENGHLNTGLELFNDVVAFCYSNQLSELGETIIQSVINYSNDILYGKGPKKLVKALTDTLKTQNPGGELLEIGIKKAQEMNSKNVIKDAATIQIEYANQQFEKKKHQIAKDFYNKALQLLIAIEDKEEATKTAQIISQQGYRIIDIKGKFQEALEFFTVLDQLEKINLDFSGDFYSELAENLFKKNYYDLSLENYKNASNAYLAGKLKEKFNQTIDAVFLKVKILIEQKEYKNALQYSNEITEILHQIKAFEQIGINLTKISVDLMKATQMNEAEELAQKAVENLLKAGKVINTGNSHKEFGETLLNLQKYENASFHFIEAAKLFKKGQSEEQIISIVSPLLNAAKNKLTNGDIELSQTLIINAVECLEYHNPLAQTNLLSEYIDHSLSLNKFELALSNYKYITKILGNSYPEEVKKITQQLISTGNKLIASEQKFDFGKNFIEHASITLSNLGEKVQGAEVILEHSQLLFNKKQPKLATELLLQIIKVLTSLEDLEMFGEKMALAAKQLIENNLFEKGIELLQKSIGAYVHSGQNETVISLAEYCANKAMSLMREKETIYAKHLYISAMEYSSLVNLEIQEQILVDATNAFLDLGDLYSIKEFYDFARNNLEGEKDYLVKLARLIIYHGTILRDKKGMMNEASDFIRDGMTLLNQVAQFQEAGEAALTQGKVFIDKGNFVFGEELIEKGAEIFIQLNNLERSGDAFLSLAEINIKKELWVNAYQQIELANKSYIDSNKEKLIPSLMKTAEIAQKALISDTQKNKDLSLMIFNNATEIAKANLLPNIEIEIYLVEARAFAAVKDFETAYNVFLQCTNLLEEIEEKEKSPEVADEISDFSNKFILENEVEFGLQLVDLATGIFLRLVQPINASEVYMKACNTLLKKNFIVEGVKLVLLASDTLMVANEFEQAVKNLEDISDLLYSMKDYQSASIVTGQIVTVHQKTGNVNEQKIAIRKLVEKAIEVIKGGKIMEGEQLWEHASNYSISVNINYVLEINNLRIENLIASGMYNSANVAFKQILPILEDYREEMLILGDKIVSIANELYSKEELELAKNFIITAVDYYKKSEFYDRAKNVSLHMSKKLIESDDETNGIDLIDLAANLSNEKEGAHEAAKIYLTSGFVLSEKGFQNSGQLSIKKAIDIELQSNDLSGCNELGEITFQKANDLANSDLELAINFYNQASKIFEHAKSYVKAGEVKTIVSSNYFNVNKAAEAIEATQEAVEFYIKGQNIDAAVVSTKLAVEAARRFFDENEVTRGVLILEKSRFLVEKIARYELLTLIINVYINSARQNLPNRKSSLGIFFLSRAIELAKSSQDSEEIVKVIMQSLSLSLDIIKMKNSLAGAKILEVVAAQETAKTILLPQLCDTYIEGLKLTLEEEWNMIGKISRDAFKFFKQTNQNNSILDLLSILTKRANADILLNKPQLGFFFLDHAVRLASEAENSELLFHIGSETYEQLLVLSGETNVEINYKLLGYCHQIFQEIQNIAYIEKVGREFVKFGSRDLVNNIQSVRGYEALLTARDIAVQTQNDNIMATAIIALLNFANQMTSNNSMTVYSTLEEIIEGLKAFEVPKSDRAAIEHSTIEPFIKALTSFGERIAKNEHEYSTGKKIVEFCLRIQALTKNQENIDNEILEIQKNMQKIFRRANKEAANRLKHAAIIMIDLSESNIAIEIAGMAFRTAQQLFDKKKNDDSIAFLETSLKIYEGLSINSELKNIGLFALSAGDRLNTEGKIQDSINYYDIAIEAFDSANDDENSNRLVNRILQTREWDAERAITYQVYKIASESAIRMKNLQKAHEIANKCFNRGIAFIDQPRIPLNLTQKFISLAGNVFEDIGAIKDAANAYDNAILKYIRLMKTRKNIEDIIVELLARTAVNRMASCDMDSLETIFLRIMELTEMKKVKHTKVIARVLKLINGSKIEEAWDLLASMPFISHGRIRKIIETTKKKIIYDLAQKGTFDRTTFSSTDRSLSLSDFLLENLIVSRKIEGQSINKDVFISLNKIKAIRNHFYSEYDLWGRVDLSSISADFNIQINDMISITRREFLSSLYMATLDNDQRTFFSFDRLKAEISLILNRERKKSSRFDPMQVAKEMRIPPDIIKEVLREIACEEVVEKAIIS